MSDYKVKPLFSSQPGPVSQPTPEPVAVPEKKVRPLFAASTPAKVAPSGPVKAGLLDLPGMFVRKRLSVDRDSMRLEYQIEEETVTQAIEVISRVNVDQIQADSFLDFGLEEQQAATNFSENINQLTTSQVVTKNLEYIQRIVELIGEQNSGLLSMFKQATTDRFGEINSKAVYLRGALKDYPEMLRQVENKMQTSGKVLMSVTAWCVAGQYVSKYLKLENDQTRLRVVDTIDRRVQSLLTTQLALRHNQLRIDQFIDNLRYQYTSVLDVLENMVPIWISSAQKNQSNPTLKTQILQVLKGSYAKV